MVGVGEIYDNVTSSDNNNGGNVSNQANTQANFVLMLNFPLTPLNLTLNFGDEIGTNTAGASVTPQYVEVQNNFFQSAYTIVTTTSPTDNISLVFEATDGPDSISQNNPSGFNPILALYHNYKTKLNMDRK